MHERVSIDSICFPGADFDQLAGHWRALGADRVSLVSPQILGDDGAGAARALQGGRCRLETIPHPFLMGRPLEPHEESWRDERARLSELIRIASRLGARSIYMLTGGHGVPTWEEAAQVFCTAIAPCVEEARAAGIMLMIENALPLYADSHIAHSLRDTLTLAEMAGIGVCIDIYGCWTEAGLQATIERTISRCGLVQLSDYVYGDRSLPSRAVPGDGAIGIRRFLDTVLSAGYGGAFDLELLGPRIDREGHFDATRRAADNVSEILVSLGA